MINQILNCIQQHHYQKIKVNLEIDLLKILALIHQELYYLLANIILIRIKLNLLLILKWQSKMLAWGKRKGWIWVVVKNLNWGIGRDWGWRIRGILFLLLLISRTLMSMMKMMTSLKLQTSQTDQPKQQKPKLRHHPKNPNPQYNKNPNQA